MEIGTVVNYSSSGVCIVSDVTVEEVLGKRSKFYVLTPVFDSRTTLYVPMDNQILMNKMRPLLSSDEIESLISSMPDIKYTWNDDDRVRSAEFKSIVSDGTHADLIRMLRCLYMHKIDLSKKGKLMRSSDEAYFKKAEFKFFSEVAYVLDISYDNVRSYIDSKLAK